MPVAWGRMIRWIVRRRTELSMTMPHCVQADFLPFIQMSAPWCFMCQVFWNPYLTRRMRMIFMEIADAAFSYALTFDTIDNKEFLAPDHGVASRPCSTRARNSSAGE
jgi:hypothetical protein